MQVRDVTMDFGYGHAFTEASPPEAYERLILDVLLGEPPLFPPRQEEVELSWKILDRSRSSGPPRVSPSSTGPARGGPRSADALLARDGRSWRRP